MSQGKLPEHPSLAFLKKLAKERLAAVEVVHLPLLFGARTGTARRLRPPRDPRRALEVARRGKLGA
jgi:hypothetical protein